MKRHEVHTALAGRYADLRVWVDSGYVVSRHWTQRGARRAADRLNASLATARPGTPTRFVVAVGETRGRSEALGGVCDSPNVPLTRALGDFGAFGAFFEGVGSPIQN